MGSQSVRFSCHHCGHCCKDVVCLPTPWDVLRIAMNTGENPKRFLEFLISDEITGVNKNDPTWLKIRGKRYLMALRRDAKTGCYFLDKRTRFCRIYAHRPILCRLYPFKLHETRDGAFSHFSLHKDVGCPRNRDGVFETKPLYDLYRQDRVHQEDYETLVDTFNDSVTEDTRPEDFLNLFLEIVEKA